MRTEHVALPAVYLGDVCAIPERREWRVVLADGERGVLREAAIKMTEGRNRLPLNEAEYRAVLSALATIEIIARDDEPPHAGE